MTLHAVHGEMKRLQIDRQILGLLVDPIKQELGATDTQMGLLQGLAFGIFYTLLGMPMAQMHG